MESSTLSLSLREAAYDAPELHLHHAPLPVGGALLSSDGRGADGRYSFLCLSPSALFSLEPSTPPPVGGAFAALERFTAQLPLREGDPIEGPVALTVCAISYEAGRPEGRHAQQGLLPSIWAARYEACYRWDHHRAVGHLIGVCDVALDSLEEWLRASAPAAAKASESAQSIHQGAPIPPKQSRATYQVALDEINEALLDGEVYQVNYTLRSEVELPRQLETTQLYLSLWGRSPSPFGALLRLDEERAIMSLSPERFLRWQADGLIETAPIKGTRPRGGNEAEDHALAQALLFSEKDRAEHLMIVDLERNDLGRVCQPATVAVRELLALHRFPHVQHLISVVTGSLRPEVGLAELLDATFPGGSITGAPKLRAIQMIERLETQPREIYCGALGYLDPRGGGDLNLPIRTGWRVGGRFFYQAGGGIVADSKVNEEWEEACLKGATIGGALSALGVQPVRS